MVNVSVQFVKMSVKGQVVIPSDVRKNLDIKDGESMLMAKGKDFVIFKKVDVNNYIKEYQRLINQTLNLNTIQQQLTIK